MVLVAVAVLLSAGIWLLIGQAASFSRLGRAITHGHPAWLLLALGVAPAGYLGYALLYQGLARVGDGPRVGLRLALRLAVALLGASVIATAAGRMGGEYWSLRRLREPPPQAWSRVLAINTAPWAILGVLAFASALAMLIDGAPGPTPVELAWALVVPACTAAAVWLSGPSQRALAADRGGRIRRTFAAAIRAIVLLRLTIRRRPVFARVLGGASLQWAGELVTVWAALRAFDTELGVAPLVLAYATGYVATMLPLPAGGAGGVDAAGTYALHLVGVPLGAALLATLVQRVLTYWLPLAVALVGARSMRRLADDLAAARSPVPVPS